MSAARPSPFSVDDEQHRRARQDVEQLSLGERQLAARIMHDSRIDGSSPCTLQLTSTDGEPRSPPARQRRRVPDDEHVDRPTEQRASDLHHPHASLAASSAAV